MKHYTLDFTDDELDRLKKATEDSIDSLGLWMIGFTGLVVVGLAIEYNQPFITFLRTHDLRVLLGSTGGLLVTIGVAGELFIDYLAHRKEQQLRIINADIDAVAAIRLKAADERIAEYAARVKEAEVGIAVAGRDAAEANERARKYEGDIAEASARAAEAEKSAAEARLELAKLKTPRRIDPEHIPTYVHLLGNFAGTKYTLSVSSDPEAIDLLRSMNEILTSSNWIWTKPIGEIMMGDLANSVTAKGITLRCAPGRRPDFQGAVLALFSALKAEQFDASLGTDPTLENNAELNIVVGIKPLTGPDKAVAPPPA
jgi:hypothetical protein